MPLEGIFLVGTTGDFGFDSKRGRTFHSGDKKKNPAMVYLDLDAESHIFWNCAHCGEKVAPKIYRPVGGRWLALFIYLLFFLSLQIPLLGFFFLFFSF